MKSLLAIVLLVGTSYFCEAQTIGNLQTQVTLPAATSYAITAQDANSRVWQSKNYQISASGGIITNTHSYTEVASGLNHLVNGKWVESKEEIDILPNGTAVATNGQHQAYFPGDIYDGQIELVTPDGQQLQSRPLALAYFDGTNTVVIAELTNSVGVLVGNNQVVYPNAFTGFNVDLRYTYTKAGFEQDIVLRQQPPTPESLGLNPGTTRLQIMTEFFSAPQPTIASTALPTQAGVPLDDESLNFGTMQMVPGRAFLMGQNAQAAGAIVSKHWLIVNGRQVLIEEVPVDAILEGLAALPLTAMNSGSNNHSHTASKYLKLPPQHLAKNNSKAMLIAKADLPARGFVLDYQTINSNTNNFTFQGDTTYYISGTVNLSGTNTFEGGAVLKYTNNATVAISGALNWRATAYRPVVFTSKDDNSVGDNITGSTGNPTNYFANPALSFGSGTFSITNFRIAWASQAINAASYGPVTFYHGQLVNCLNGITGSYTAVYLRNLLFATVQTNFNIGYSSTLNVQNTTFSGSSCLISGIGDYTSPTLTNCILASISRLTNGLVGTIAGDHNGFYSSPTFGTSQTSAASYPFQSAVGGNYYLATGGNFLNAGTTNIDAALMTSLKQKTTWPPIMLSNVTVAANINLSPQAQRDTDIPDLGYHYDPLDYIFGGVVVGPNTTITVNAGTAIGMFYAAFSNSSLYNSYASSQFYSQGVATSLNRIVECSAVQESSLGKKPTVILEVISGGVVNCQFNDFSVMANDAFSVSSYSATSFNFQNCQFHGGQVLTASMVASFINCLFERVILTIQDGTIRNDLFWNNSSLSFQFFSTGTLVENNMFYKSTIADGSSVSYIRGYNGYYATGGTFLHGTNSTDRILTNDIGYQAGFLGNYYQPTNSPLVDKGSTNANLLALYQFTTQTNQVKEANSIVDIGYHYVAVDANGNPVDTDGDGIPDYLEDANGNGLVDNGENSWTNYNSFNGLISPNGLVVFTPLK